MKARFIGPEHELGATHSVDFFGNTLTREWSEVTLSPEQVEKANGNKYVELKGTAKAADPAADADRAATEARLTELGVDFTPGSSMASLNTKLTKAETAARVAEEEAQAAADELAGASQDA